MCKFSIRCVFWQFHGSPTMSLEDVIQEQMGAAPVLVLLQADQQLVKQHHFARGAHESVDGVQVFVVPPEFLLRRAEQEGVVAALLQLDNDVEQRNLRPTAL